MYANTITGKLLSAGTGPAQWKYRMSGCGRPVSPLTKCATTRITRYPIEISATTLVYLSESSRRRKDSGLTTSLDR